jgi:hypothetical protein
MADKKLNQLPFDVICSIAHFLQPNDFFKLSKSCRGLWSVKNHPHILQQFSHIPIDQHLKEGHVSLLKWKHSTGVKCNVRLSMNAVSHALENDFEEMFKYLLTNCGKIIEWKDAWTLASKCTNPRMIDLFLARCSQNVERGIVISCFRHGNMLLYGRLVAVKGHKFSTLVTSFEYTFNSQLMKKLISHDRDDSRLLFMKVLMSHSTIFKVEKNEQAFVQAYAELFPQELDKNTLDTLIKSNKHYDLPRAVTDEFTFKQRIRYGMNRFTR